MGHLLSETFANMDVCGRAGQGWRTACLRGQVPRVAADQLAPILKNHQFKPVLSFQGATLKRSSMPGMATRVQTMKNWV